MGFLGVAFGIAGTVMFFIQDRSWLAVIAGIVAAFSFWTYGVMHNYAVRHASQRRAGYQGGFANFTEADLAAVPDRLAAANMVGTILAFVLLIVAGMRFW